MRAISPEPRGGVFFNKRLLQEAGIDPDSIYDMQANGTWTWETFEEMCKKCTRDLDNDGVNDIYAMASLSTEFCYLALDSNSASLIGRGPDGKLFNNAGSDNSMEAWNWIRHMVDNYEMPSPEGANWDWMYTAFANGETAFTIDQEYTVQVGGRYHDMKDDYGFVCFPMGPKGDGKYKTLHDDNMYIIPGSYDDETAQNIAKAFDLWTDPVPGYEGSDTWKESYYPMFRDERAVDETLALMLENANPRFDTLVAGFNAGSFVWNFWGGWATPQEQYEATKNEWQALINDANR
jgi:ABC-type glycerol-3-phosphate transport system substrate-binding protein